MDHGDDDAADIQRPVKNTGRETFNEEEGRGASYEDRGSSTGRIQRRMPAIWKWLSLGRGADVYW